MGTMGITKPKRRRRTHDEAFKAELVGACSERGVSIAGIALANGINPNLLRRWMREREVVAPSFRPCVERTEPVVRAPEFMPVMITPSAAPVSEIRIEVRRRDATVKVEWPVSAASECAAWLRDWLK
jgi:transposase